MAALIQIYCDARREWRWRLVAANGRTIADSGEGYKRKSGALRAVDTLRYIMGELRGGEVEVVES